MVLFFKFNFYYFYRSKIVYWNVKVLIIYFVYQILLILSKSMEEGDVRELFKEFGQIEDCSILRDQGKSKGILLNVTITFCYLMIV